MTLRELRDLIATLPSNLHELDSEERATVLDKNTRNVTVGTCKICRLHGEYKLVNSYCNSCEDFCCQEHMSWSMRRGVPKCHVCGMTKDELTQKELFKISAANRAIQQGAHNPDPSGKD